MTEVTPHFHSGPREDKDWKKFQDRCEDLISRSLPDSAFRVVSSKRLKDSRKEMDIHVAERRQGGRGFVFECKHYPKTKIRNEHVDQVVKYKRKCRASAAVLLISKATERADKLPQSVRTYAESNAVLVLVVEDVSRGLLRDWLGRRMIDRDIRDVVR